MAKILVADDDKVMLGLLKTLMELEGDEVVTATRPQDIVPLAQSHDITMILMDYHLAGGDSMSALDVLKSDDTLRQIPVLVASGMDYETECLKKGAEGFILKPFRPADLLSRMRKIMEVTQ